MFGPRSCYERNNEKLTTEEHLMSEECCGQEISESKLTKLTEKQAVAALAQLAPGWVILETNGARSLQKSYRQADFASGMQLLNDIAQVAQVAHHHPMINLTFTELRVSWTTYAAGGITQLDLLTAQSCDELAALRAELRLSARSLEDDLDD